MKIVIRKGMFETNSSTSHSIIINKGDVLNHPYIEKYGVESSYTCDSNRRSYGRQSPKILMDPISKINFLMAFKAWNLDHNKKDWSKVNKEFREKLISICFNKGLNIDIKPIVDYNYIIEEGFFTLIDFEKYIDDINFLEKFIFDMKSFIVITGDEYRGFFELSNLLNFINYNHEKIPENSEIPWYSMEDSMYEEESENENDY